MRFNYVKTVRECKSKNKILVPDFVYIGSRQRLFFPVSKIIRGGTLFVEPQEYDVYNSLHGENFNIVKLSKNNGGFPFLLNSMLEYAKTNKQKYFIFCDDDVLGFTFRKKTTLVNEIKNMIEIAQEKKYSQLMMSFKGHNWFYKGRIKEKIGCWCFVLNKVSDIEKVGGYDNNLKIYNDWDVSANLIKNGFKTACYYGAMFDHKMKSMRGGAEEIYKKQELLDQAKDVLIKKYGTKCLIEKKIHGQVEIRFLWRNL